MKFVDIKNDLAFRKIFGNENTKEVLISFLNAILTLANDKKIVEIELLNTYQLPELLSDKVTIIDVKARDQNNSSYIVEMQVAKVDELNKRVLYYASQSYTSQIDRGDLYEKLSPVFFIGILDFSATTNPHYIRRHKILDVATHENYISDIEFNFIELPKFTKAENELETIIDQWVYFIKNAEDLRIIPENVKVQGLKIAYEKADKHNWTKLELEEYNKIFIKEQDERGKVTYAVRTAKEEQLNQVAVNFLNLGISIEDTAKGTGLTIEQVVNLKGGL